MKNRSFMFGLLGVVAGAVCMLTFTPIVHAQSSYELDPPTIITVVGCQVAPGPCYLVTSPVPPQNCLYNTIYIQIDSVGNWRAIYSTAMLALSTGKAIRVIYTQTGGSGGGCNVGLLSIGG